MAAVATAWPTKKQPVVSRLLMLSFIVPRNRHGRLVLCESLEWSSCEKNFAKKNKQMDDSVSAFVNVCGWFVGMIYKQVNRAYLQ